MITIPHGFLPLISDDGQTIACGFNQVLSVALPGGAVTPIDVGGEASGAGYHQGRIAISKYLPNGRELIGGPISVPPEQLPGVNPTRAVAGGHVVSSAQGQHYIDGQMVTAYDPAGSDIETFDGQHYGYKAHTGNPWPFIVRRVDNQAALIVLSEPITNAVVWTDQTGAPWVFSNLNGSANLANTAGGFWQFQLGEYRGALSDGPDGPWAWTCGQFTDGSPFICGRPFSDLRGPGLILRGMWWAGLGAVWEPYGLRWVVAGYYDGPGGTLYINPAVDPAQPKEVLDFSQSQPPVQPPVTPQPPIVTPPTMRIVTVRAGETVMIQGLP